MRQMDGEAQELALHIRMKHLATMPQAVCWFLVALALVICSHVSLAAVAISDVAPLPPVTYPQPGCPSKCGEVDIPYPFGVDDDKCSWPGMLTIACNQSFSPPRPFIFSNIEIINISVETGEMQVYTTVSSICYNSDSISTTEVSFDFSDTPLLISATRNVFTAIGCNTLALLLNGMENKSFYTGCITSCTSVDEAAPDGERCTGLGCCQTPVPGNLSAIQVDWNNGSDSNPAWSYSPCSYGFVSAENWYHYKRQDLRSDDGKEGYIGRAGDRNIPMVLDWAISGNGSCLSTTEDGRKPTAPACASANSQCVNATQGPQHGYLCNCSEGYQGNPYIPDGCRDINECELRKSNPSKYRQLYPCGSGSKCQNMPGDYKCKCKFWYTGDGKSTEGCHLRRSVYAYIILATCVLVGLACFAIVLLQRQMLTKRFNENGGKLLKDLGIHTFTKAELKKITDGYKKTIGEGAYGKVYKGVIGGTQQVAVKCSAPKGKTLPVEEFMNEIKVLFRLNHTNVVRLVGCCLETDVPMLVFEFVPKGSLYDILHGIENVSSTLPLPERMGIAIGSAAALAYMHAMHTHGGHDQNMDMHDGSDQTIDMHGGDGHSMNINGGHNHVHGDIKSGNILLDDELQPKVSDFGSSKLLTIGYTRSIAADMSYIDPVCMKTGRLTVKSDVYSFGVVLLELITRRKAKVGDNSLPIDFVKLCKKEGNGRKMYDTELLSNDIHAHRYMECLDRIGVLAVQCLKEDQDERPAMAEVLKELKQARDIAFGSSRSQASSVHVDQAGN